MFNLLPDADKATIRREYRLRLLTVILWGVFTTALIASLLLVPSLALSRQREEAARARFETLSKRAGTEEVASFTATLQEVDGILALLRSEAPEVLVYETVRVIASRRPPEISLDGITVSPAAGGKREIQISGVAANRAALVSFSRSLEAGGVFERVELPLSNLAKSEDITFSLNVTVRF